MQGLLENPVLFGTAFVVHEREGTSQPRSLVMRVGTQHVVGQHGTAQSAGGVDARREIEDDLTGPKRGHRRKAAGRLEGGQSGTSGLRNGQQTVLDQYAVLASEGNHVRQRSKRHEIEHFAHIQLLSGQFFQPGVERGHKEEGHADPGEMRTGIFSDTGIGDGLRVRKFRRGQMVIGDDYGEAQFAARATAATSLMPQSTVSSRALVGVISAASPSSAGMFRPYPSVRRSGRCTRADTPWNDST